MSIFRTLLAVCLWGCASVAMAVPITLIHTSSGAGSLAGNPFADSNFTITALGDTDDIQSLGGSGAFIDHLSASIEIDGLGTFDFTSPTRTFINGTTVGFSRAGIGGLDLLNGPNSPALSGWDMLTSIGPVAGNGSLIQWSISPSVTTSGGTLIFTNGQPQVTFQAIVGASAVPEPGILLLLGLGLAGLGLSRRRKV